MIAMNTSGYNQQEIYALLREGGKLSDSDELFFATAGGGTDEAKIKEVLKGKSKADVDKIRDQYEAVHG